MHHIYNSEKPIPGSLAQLVEQRPEEPCVPSSSLGGATRYFRLANAGLFYLSSQGTSGQGLRAIIYTLRAPSLVQVWEEPPDILTRQKTR